MRRKAERKVGGGRGGGTWGEQKSRRERERERERNPGDARWITMAGIDKEHT